MEYSYCKNCGKMTGHKRHLGVGTILGSVVTGGASLAAVPFYPKRCIICGKEKEQEEQSTGFDLGFVEDEEQVAALDSRATKICPQCAEEVKVAAKICRFCRYEFPESSFQSPQEKFENLRAKFLQVQKEIDASKDSAEKARLRKERDQIYTEIENLRKQGVRF